MVSGERQAPRRAARRPSVRERWEATAVDEDTALEAMTEELMDRVVGPAWERLGPLSAGAVAGSVAIVGARGLLRRLFGRRYGRILSWLGAVSLVPVALWLLSGSEGEKDSEPQAEDNPSGLPDGGHEKIDG
ncbi:MAG: hypothetical protein GTO46_02735 [Gemmatimonadetes bacterium]|nr:hypothetical protein [Gemmatimonadota bacterium]NIO30698.1 hypothetical protein [Gemmatimonadota bacterium]